jgi:cell division protein FtsQ
MSMRRISIRKIIQTLVTLVAVAGCALAMISADRQQAHRKVKGVQLIVKSPAGVRFLTDDAVRNMLFTSRHVDPAALTLAQVNERSMEAILRTNPWVKDAQVYTDAERIMHIILTQRVPLVRIFEEDGNSYYLDAALQAMPLSAQYTHYTPVITGVPKLGSDSGSKVVKGKIVGLVQHIKNDTFWNAQVSQIDMSRDGRFELIPVLGKQRIIVGDTSRLQQKLDNLFAFYKQVQNKVGWDKYNILDLRFEGQVVASPSLPWKAPVDRALTNINWVQAIMDNAPKQVQLGGDAGDALDNASAPPPSPLETDADVAASQAQQAIKPPPVTPLPAPPVKVTQPKPMTQATHKDPKPKPPSVKKTSKPTKPQQHLQTNTSHKKNTTTHALPTR